MTLTDDLAALATMLARADDDARDWLAAHTRPRYAPVPDPSTLAPDLDALERALNERERLCKHNLLERRREVQP